jgi:hypothetical protein
MDFSAKLDDLQQRPTDVKAAAQAAVSKSRRTVDHARLAVLDAIDARAYTDELAQQRRRQ